MSLPAPQKLLTAKLSTSLFLITVKQVPFSDNHAKVAAKKQISIPNFALQAADLGAPVCDFVVIDYSKQVSNKNLCRAALLT